jgi:hypothetical protein
MESEKWGQKNEGSAGANREPVVRVSPHIKEQKRVILVNGNKQVDFFPEMHPPLRASLLETLMRIHYGQPRMAVKLG